MRKLAGALAVLSCISLASALTTEDPLSRQTQPGRLIDYFWDDDPDDGAGPAEIGNHTAIAEGLDDIKAHGFTDALIGTRTIRQVQSSFEDLVSKDVIESMRFACRQGQRIGLRTWLRLDPVKTDESHAFFLHLKRAAAGETVHPAGEIAAVFAVTIADGAASAVDVTSQIQAADGGITLPDGQCDHYLVAWREGSFADLASPEAVENMREVLGLYRELRPDGIWQDEAGWRAPAPWDEAYEETYTMSERLLARIKLREGIDLAAECWQLVEPGPDFVRVRNAYFTALQDAFSDLWTAWRDVCWGLFGDVRFGVHFSALETGARHGLLSGHMDYFPLTRITRAGYWDSSGFRDPASERDAAYCWAMARSLGKWSPLQNAYMNIWGEDPTPASIDLIFDRCIALGVGYFAHAYGNTFLFGPGYPNEVAEGDVPTWDLFSFENEKARLFAGFTRGELPRGDVLFYYPAETYAAYQLDCERIHDRVKELAFLVQKAGYTVDYASAHTLKQAFADEGRIVLYGRAYQALVIPCANVLAASTWERVDRLGREGCTVIFADPSLPSVREGDRPFMDTSGRLHRPPPRRVAGERLPEALDAYGARPPVRRPAGTIASHGKSWVIVGGVSPYGSRPRDFSGTVAFGGVSWRVGLCRLVGLDAQDPYRIAVYGYDEARVDGRCIYRVRGGSDVRAVYASSRDGAELVVCTLTPPERVSFLSGGVTVSPHLPEPVSLQIGGRRYLFYHFSAGRVRPTWREVVARSIGLRR